MPLPQEMSDFGVSMALPNLSPADEQKVVKFLMDDMGVLDESDLEVLEVNDFTEGKILGKADARRLLEYWRKGLLLVFVGSFLKLAWGHANC